MRRTAVFRVTALGLFAFLGTLPGCGGSPLPPGFEVADSAGVRVLRPAAAEGTRPLVLRAVPEVGGEIGPHALGGEQDLGTIRDFGFSPAGQLLVVSGAEPIFRWFSRAGVLQGRSFVDEPRADADRGGPAFRLEGVDRRNRVRIWDPRIPGVVERAPDGAERRRWEGGADAPAGGDRVALLPNGHLVVRTREEVPGPDGAVQEFETISIHDASGSPIARLGRWPGRVFRPVDGVSAHLPFTLGPPVGVRGNEVLVALADGTVQVFDPQGALRAIVDPGAPRRTVSAEDRAAFIRMGVNQVGERVRERLEAIGALVPDGTPLPVFDHLLVDPFGTVWLRHSLTDLAGPVRWSLLDSRGTPMGEAETPPGLVVRAVHRDRVAGAALHPSGFEVLRIHELEEPTG